ncbi:MAG TPA: DUF6438 domain-containing protein [Taishania sp.]|nr:DUF6438 domain-containing protein [Taishania sp.]
MKKVIYLFIATVVIIGMNACASKKNGTTAVDTNSNEPIALQSGKTTKKDSLFASLERSACFGTCPVYSVNIYSSGYAEYVGTLNTKMIGTYSTTFSKEQLNSLVETANAINYMSLDDVYDTKGITDLPSHISSIVINKQRKVVTRRHNYPDGIIVFEKKIDELVESADWKKLRD